jgi:hypothetical protein
MNAVLVPDRDNAASRKPRSLSELRRADELTRAVSAETHLFRIQYVGAAPDRGSTTLKEVEVQVADVSAAIIAAASLEWPRTIGLRILDPEGREVFGRQKAGRR